MPIKDTQSNLPTERLYRAFDLITWAHSRCLRADWREQMAGEIKRQAAIRRGDATEAEAIYTLEKSRTWVRLVKESMAGECFGRQS